MGFPPSPPTERLGCRRHRANPHRSGVRRCRKRLERETCWRCGKQRTKSSQFTVAREKGKKFSTVVMSKHDPGESTHRPGFITLSSHLVGIGRQGGRRATRGSLNPRSARVRRFDIRAGRGQQRWWPVEAALVRQARRESAREDSVEEKRARVSRAGKAIAAESVEEGKGTATPRQPLRGELARTPSDTDPGPLRGQSQGALRAQTNASSLEEKEKVLTTVECTD